MSAVSLLSSRRRPMHVGVTVLLAISALLAAQAPFDTLRAQPSDEPSLARIKAALAKPAPKLVIPPPKADFRVNIDAIRPFADLFELPPWVTPPSDFAAPHAGCARP